ncbi:MAG: GAF domain-containing protein [Elusimicrobiota bacterium]
MSTCPECDKVILSDYKFCPRCGKPLLPDLSRKESSLAVEQNKKQKLQFFDIVTSLSKSDNIDQLLKKISTAVEDILEADRSSIMLLDDNGKDLYFKTASGESILKKLKIPLGKGIAGWIAKNREPVIVNEPYQDERFSPETDKKTGYRTESIVGAPLIYRDKLLGIVEAINKKSGKFNQSDKETLIGFAGLAAATIDNTKLLTEQKNFFSNMQDFLVMGIEALGHPEDTEKGHSWEMARYVNRFGDELGLSEKKINNLHSAALLHDIGFLGLENTELVGININTQLNSNAKFRLHPVIGAEMVKTIHLIQDLKPYILAHHRYIDGTGFPENISTQTITPDMEIISILELYLLLKDKNKVQREKFSPEVYKAFQKIIPE